MRPCHLLFTILVSMTFTFVKPHGALIDPRARNALYLDPAFPNQPPNWNYQAVWCDNTPQDENISNCGMCGDHLSQSAPRENENGGYYGNGYIAKTYQSGTVSYRCLKPVKIKPFYPPTFYTN